MPCKWSLYIYYMYMCSYIEYRNTIDFGTLTFYPVTLLIFISMVVFLKIPEDFPIGLWDFGLLGQGVQSVSNSQFYV